MEIAKLIRRVSVSPIETLEQAFERIAALFEYEGLKVHKPEYLNNMVLAKDFSRIINIYQDDVKYTIFIIISSFNEEKINLILNSFLQTNEKSKVFFISAYPLPGILSLINQNSPASFFELDALRNLKKVKELSERTTTDPHYSEVFKNLVLKYFNVEITNEPAKALKRMENIIIEFYRKCDDYEEIYETDIEYFPYYSMVLFGLHLGDMLATNFNGDLFYHADQEIEKLGIGYSVENDDLIDMMVYPVDKVFKFFYSGKNSSIINWYYELKYFFNNKEKLKEQFFWRKA